MYKVKLANQTQADGIRLQTRIRAASFPQNVLARRKLSSTFSGLDKAKAKKMNELDAGIRQLKLRHVYMSSKRAASTGNKVKESLLLQPGFRFHKNGDFRQYNSGFTEIDLNKNVSSTKSAQSQKSCNLRHEHNEVCRINSMSNKELDAEIARLSVELKSMKADADKVFADFKKKSSEQKGRGFLHAHTNDYTPDKKTTPTSRSTSGNVTSRHSSVRHNCSACHFDLKLSSSEAELKRYLQRRNDQWTRWKIAPSGTYSAKSYVPSLLFFDRGDDVPAKSNSAVKSSRLSTGKKMTSEKPSVAMTTSQNEETPTEQASDAKPPNEADDAIDKVFEANQVDVEADPASLKLLGANPIQLDLNSTEISEMTSKVSKTDSLRKLVLKRSAMASLSKVEQPATFYDPDSQLYRDFLEAGVDGQLLSVEESPQKFENDTFERNYNTFPCPQSCVSTPLTFETGNTVQNRKLAQEEDFSKPVKQVAFSTLNALENEESEVPIKNSVSLRSRRSTNLSQEDSEMEEAATTRSQSDLDRKKVLKDRAAMEMNATLWKIGAFMSKLPSSNPTLKTWRDSSGRLTHFNRKKITVHGLQSPRSLEKLNALTMDTVEKVQSVPSSLDRPKSSTSNQSHPSRSKPFVSPWGRINADLHVMEKDPNSLKCLMQCRYLRPYQMKKVQLAA